MTFHPQGLTLVFRLDSCDGSRTLGLLGILLEFSQPFSGDIANTNARRQSIEAKTKRGLMVSSKWGQAIVIVFLFGFFVMGLLACRTYTSEPPIPAKVVDPSGQVLFTQPDIMRGQETFLRNGLMEYGSIFGHGAYLGPDFTADYLHRAALIVRQQYGDAASDRAQAQTIQDFKTNRFNPTTGALEYTAAQATAFKDLEAHTRAFSPSLRLSSGCAPKPLLIRSSFTT